MKYSFILLGCSAALVAFVQPVSAKSAAEIEAIARSVSVEMISGVGSGVLVHRQGDVYTVITNRHVVCAKESLCDESGVRNSYQLKTADGQVYQVGQSAIKLLKDAGGNKLDLAIVQFRSSRNYAVAQVAEPGSLKVGDAVYMASFPQGQGWLFGQGEVYVNGLLSNYPSTLADYNQAISLNPKDAEAYNNRGFLKAYKLNDSQGALADYNQAISLNPQYANAYYNRGVLKHQKLNDPKGALVDYNQAISLNPQYANAYYNRAILKKEKLKDFQGALADYNQAISLNPEDAEVYNNRGLLKADKLNDPQGALADYNQAISLNPQYANAYVNRGNLKDDLNDPKGALADHNQAIALKPKDANAYHNRGALKYNELNDRPGGIADLRTAAQLYRSQGNTAKAQQIMDALRQLGVSE